MREVPRLHLISNREICSIERFPEVARLAAEGGADAIHLREPGLAADELVGLYERTRLAIGESRTSIYINRSIDVATEVQAGGLHLAEAQVPEAQAVRSRLSSGMVLGASVHSTEGAKLAEANGVDYLIAGHVFETGSKPGQAGRGVEFIPDITSGVQIPVIAIGGITPENARQVIEAGAHGVAVLSAILATPEPREVAAAFARVLTSLKGD